MRSFNSSALQLLLAVILPAISAAAMPAKTRVSIVGEDFHINGQPTYAGRSWNGHRIEGLLLNSRMVQATFDVVTFVATLSPAPSTGGHCPCVRAR